MNHSRIVEMVSAYVDDELDQQARSFIETHVNGCSECSRRMVELKTMAHELRSAADVTLRPSFAANVLRAIRQSADESTGWMLAEFMARRVLVGLSVLVLLTFGYTTLNETEPQATVERYLRGEPSDSAESQILNNAGEISRDDVLLAAVSKR